jgi:large repetitive protein
MSLAFSGTAGQRISLQIQPTSGSITGVCSDISILQPGGTTSIFTGGGCPNKFIDPLMLPVTGSYTIVLNVGGTGTGTEKFTLYDVPPDVSGTIAANGTPVSLTTTAPGQNMSLTFSGTAGQRISLQAQATSGSITGICSDLYILQPDGVTKFYSGGGCPNLFSDVLILPVAGSYTIVLNVGGTATGTAAFTLYDLPPDANATITPGGGSVSLTTTTPGQNMNLVFNATAGQRVSLLAQPVSGSISGTCSNFSILHPNGTTRVYSGGGCPSLFSDVVSLPVTGSYTIVLNVGGTATGTETFTLYDVPPDATGTTTVGQAAANYDVTVPGQAIQVSFAGAANQGVSVIVSRVSSTPSGACYNITTRKPDGSTLRGDSSCSGGYSSGSLTLPVAGTYTVAVDPTSTSIGTFSVGVNTP